MQLVRFLMKLASEYVQIELKNGTVVAGTVLSVTPNMNTVLKDVRMTIKGEDPVTLDSITIRGNSIRFFILPETVPLDNMIVDESRKPRTMRPPPPKRPARGGFVNNTRESFTRGGSTRGRGMRGASRGRGPLRGGSSSFRGGRGGTRGDGPGYPRHNPNRDNTNASSSNASPQES